VIFYQQENMAASKANKSGQDEQEKQ
jgi:hypothetical protein